MSHAEPESAEALVQQLLENRPPAEAVANLAELLNRAAARLHQLARSEASARKDQPDWPTWAQLQNASRSLVLQSSTCRDLAQRIAGRPR